MPIVNFAVSQSLKQKIDSLIEEYGFGSQAEFFRFLAINFWEKDNKIELSSEAKIDLEFNKATQELTALIKKKYGGKKLPSAEEQLADLM